MTKSKNKCDLTFYYFTKNIYIVNNITFIYLYFIVFMIIILKYDS